MYVQCKHILSFIVVGDMQRLFYLAREQVKMERNVDRINGQTAPSPLERTKAVLTPPEASMIYLVLSN